MAEEIEDKDRDEVEQEDETPKKEKREKKLKTRDPKKYIEIDPVLNEQPEPDDEMISEAPLSIQQRLKRGRTMRRFRTKIAAARRRLKRRKASPEKLKARAQRKALKIIKDRLSRNKPYREMSPSEKVALDKRVQRMPKTMIQRIARRELPKVRQAEVQRLANLGKGQKRENTEDTTNLDNLFEKFLIEGCDTAKKRYHQLLDKDGKPKHDMRFRMYKNCKARPQDDLEDALEIMNVTEARFGDDPSDREQGTDSLVQVYKDATPGESYQSSNIPSTFGDFKRGDRIKFSTHSMALVDDGEDEGTIIDSDTQDITVRSDTGKEYKVRHTNASHINEAFQEQFGYIIDENTASCPIITMSQMKQFEGIVDKLFKKFGIDFEFTRHFRERMSHDRNDPCIDLKELAALIKKLYEKYRGGDRSLSKHKDAEVVIKDLQSNLNMPVALEYDRRNDQIDIIAKTIMRKPNFRTPNPIIKV
ncbi:MAG: hypothetical protein WCY93_08540 [Anaerolineaceae bacterium]